MYFFFQHFARLQSSIQHQRMPPSSASLLPLGPFYWWMLHTHVLIVEPSSSWGLYCTTLHIIVTIERFVRMCEWTSTSGQITKRALRVSKRNRKAPLKVFRRSERPCTYNIQYPIAEGNFLEPSHLLLSPLKRQVIYRQNYFGFIHLQGFFSDLGLLFERQATIFQNIPRWSLCRRLKERRSSTFKQLNPGFCTCGRSPK